MDPKAIAILASVLTGATLLSITNIKYFQSVELVSEGWRSEEKHQDLLFSPNDTEDKIDINEFLIGIIENFKLDMTIGIPELKIPILDPFDPKKTIRVDVDDNRAVFHGNFSNVFVEGLSGFEMVSLNADLQNLSLQFHLKVPWIKATGNYTIDGKLIKIIPLRGNGEFRVESNNITVAAKASIITSDAKHLLLSEDLDVFIDFEKVDLYLENFLGGGKWTEMLLKIVNDMSRDVFRKLLPLLKGELNRALLKVINKHLMKIPITSLIPGSNADDYVDQILTNVQEYVKQNNLDPMQLPDFASNFSKEVMYVTFRGEAKLFDGWLSGISSIRRTNQCTLATNRTFLSVSANLGLSEMKLSYKGLAKFMSWGPTLVCGGSVKTVAFYFKIEQSNRKGAKPSLKEFEITELSTIWIELSGLGPLTWILKWLLTGISKLVENFIVNKVSLTIKQQLEREFQKLSFPV